MHLVFEPVVSLFACVLLAMLFCAACHFAPLYTANFAELFDVMHTLPGSKVTPRRMAVLFFNFASTSMYFRQGFHMIWKHFGS